NKVTKKYYHTKNNLTLRQRQSRSSSLPHPIDELKNVQRNNKNKQQLVISKLNDSQNVHHQQIQRRSVNRQQKPQHFIKGKTGVKVKQPIPEQLHKHKSNKTQTFKSKSQQPLFKENNHNNIRKRAVSQQSHAHNNH
ncbi:unnamed protein product, partial [Didymodactylos carnosus]